jgi:hypothetical protein
MQNCHFYLDFGTTHLPPTATTTTTSHNPQEPTLRGGGRCTTRPPAPRRVLARCHPRPRPRRWACGGGPATAALITPARRRRLPSHASDRRRSWSVTPGVRPAVTLALPPGTMAAAAAPRNPRPRPGPRISCPVPPPSRPHRTSGRKVPGGAGERAPGRGRLRPASGGIDHRPCSRPPWFSTT